MSVDPDFETRKGFCDDLYTIAVKLKTDVNAFLAGASSFAKSSLIAADDLRGFLNHGDSVEGSTDALTPLVTQAQTLSARISKESFEQVETDLKENVIAKADDLVKKLEDLKKRIQHRQETRLNFDHYVQKVGGLRKKHEDAMKKGKESVKDLERLQRNEEKLQEMSAYFRKVNKELVVDLENLWRDRFSVLGPIFANMLSAQQRLLSVMHSSFQELQINPNQQWATPQAEFEYKEPELPGPEGAPYQAAVAPPSADGQPAPPPKPPTEPKPVDIAAIAADSDSDKEDAGKEKK